MGDFNYPQIDWCTSTLPGGDNSPAVMFLDSCEDIYLVQHVQNVTRSRGGQQPSLLDLVFTSTLKLLTVSPIWHFWDLVIMTCYYGATHVCISQSLRPQRLINGIILEVTLLNLTSIFNS